MIDISSLDDIAALQESDEVECKLAQGRNGKGALPKDMWESYSAFANTQGGNLFLGLKERKDGAFELAGIENTQGVLDDLWNCLNNTQKVSGNLLRERWVKVVTIENKDIIQIYVPPASRKQTPVFINGNPLSGTYKRLHSADMRQNEESVRRMLAEQVEESRDSEIIKGYGIDDLALESVNAYRQFYINRQPDHPWNQDDVQTFLYNIGAWGKDREAGYSGLTRGGLLMFGQHRPIKEAFPHYFVDYQERPEAKTEARWVDRITPDGTWSGNLFDFYGKVIRKLTADLKVPFELEGDQRQEDTSVHEALREAFVNALIHADYTERASVFVVKRPDMFGFRNPGTMRVPIEQAKQGGHSDCRNRNLQDMFRYIGLGENAGSGLPKIFSGWNSQHWRSPVLHEKIEPSDQTLLEMHMLSLVPEKIIAQLQEELSATVFDALSDQERLILVTAKIEKTIDHRRMMSIMDIHPRDLSVLLASLVEKELIFQDGAGKGTIYFLAETRMSDALLESEANAATLKGPELGSGGLDVSSGCLEELKTRAATIAERKKAPATEVSATILALCSLCPLRLEALEKLLNRSGESLRKNYLQPLMQDKKLRLLYVTKPNHPEQAYITIGSKADKEGIT